MNSLNLNRISLKLISKEAPYFQPLLATLVIYLTFVYLFTLNPFQFSLVHLHNFMQFRKGYVAAIIGGAYIQDIILNLIMLFPLGLVIGLLLRMHQISKKHCLTIATAFAFLISASVEICQTFLPRSFSIVDILANTVGACIGARLAFPIRGFDSREIFKQIYEKGRSFYTCLVFGYCLAATFILMIPVFMNTFHNWNNDFHLLIGNEATLNRPWNGIIYKLSIFNRRFSDHEVEKFYGINFQHETPANLSNGLLIEYLFTNPHMKKFGPLQDDLVLSERHGSSIAFKQSGGIILNNNSLLATSKQASNLVQSLKETNQLSIAIWFQPENLRHRGPARIVSLSKNTEQRNFMLGQIGPNIDFRVRTPLKGLNGSKVELTTYPILTTDKPQLIVATFHRGETKLYYNDSMRPAMIYDTSYYLPLISGMGNNRFGKAAFCFMLLFPLGWLARGLVKVKIWKSIVSSLIAFIPFVILSFVNITVFHHQLDLHLCYLCLFISALLLVIGILYELIFSRYGIK